MAVLKDDCFEASTDLMALDQAVAILHTDTIAVCGVEEVSVADCLGRVLAEDLAAPQDVPPHDNSAVDGYAVYASDLESGSDTQMKVTGRIAAGHPLDRAAVRGEALRIFTGAPMPTGPVGELGGPDTIFMQEDVVEAGGVATFPPGIKPGANRRRQGEDVKRGDIIIHTGQRLRAQDLGLAASIGRARAKVFKPLRAAIFSTGDEVFDPASGEAPKGGIYDANRPAIRALLAGLGCVVTDLGILHDDPKTIQGAVADAAQNHDLLITSGGVSLGEEDHVAGVVQQLGRLHFWRLAIKPGRPIALGLLNDGACAFVGLPGNPVAAMVTFMMVARPMIQKLSGEIAGDAPRFQVPAAFSMDKKPGRLEWLRGNLQTDTNGTLQAHKFRSQGAGILTSMVASDGLIEVPSDTTRIDEGDLVSFIPFGSVT